MLGLISEKVRVYVEFNRDFYIIEEVVEYVIEFEEVIRYFCVEEE